VLRSFEEIRDPQELPIPAPSRKPAEIKMARMLIDQMSEEEWDPTQHPNEYRKALEKLLTSKRKFALKEPAKARAEVEGGKVIDLMDALRRSVGQAKARPKATGRRRAGAA
jgi:DNA end-binding protein Ku